MQSLQVCNFKAIPCNVYFCNGINFILYLPFTSIDILINAKLIKIVSYFHLKPRSFIVDVFSSYFREQISFWKMPCWPWRIGQGSQQFFYSYW